MRQATIGIKAPSPGGELSRLTTNTPPQNVAPYGRDPVKGSEEREHAGDDNGPYLAAASSTMDKAANADNECE
jgi:hypothetical protein